MEYAQILDKVLWAVMIGISGYVAKTIAQLNEKMATIVERVSHHDDKIKEHSEDIKKLYCKGE